MLSIFANKGFGTTVATPFNEDLQIKPGTNVAILNGLLHVILRDNLIDEKYIEERTENFDKIREAVKDYTPEKVAEITGVKPEDVEKV